MGHFKVWAFLKHFITFSLGYQTFVSRSSPNCVKVLLSSNLSYLWCTSYGNVIWSKWNDSIIIKASSHFLQSELCLKVSTLCKVWYMALQIALSMTNIEKVHLFQYSKLAVPLLKLESKQFKYLKCLPSRLNVEKLNHYSRWHSCYANST